MERAFLFSLGRRMLALGEGHDGERSHCANLCLARNLLWSTALEARMPHRRSLLLGLFVFVPLTPLACSSDSDDWSAPTSTRELPIVLTT